MRTELKNCPFCGGRARYCMDVEHDDGPHECHYIVCKDCSATVDFTPTIDGEQLDDSHDALQAACAELWNQRADFRPVQMLPLSDESKQKVREAIARLPVGKGAVHVE